MIDSSKLKNHSQGFSSKYPISTKKVLQGDSSPFSYRKYSWTVNPVFHKIYARKWLYTAVCGRDIFLVTFSWRKRWDSNPRYREVQLISSQSRYDHFDTLP